jgi:glycolate oxidase subunit GlcD
MALSQSLASSLADAVGDEHLLTTGIAQYLADEAQTSGLRGHADAVVRPGSADAVSAVLRTCYDAGVAITPRGGGTGYCGGAIPFGGVVLSLERLNRILAFEPPLWRIHVEAGVTTAALRTLVRENGLFFPPDPGAAESSQIGGNVATNAGGPHAFKYGTTGRWVTGIEAVLPCGDVVRVGGPLRKDVAGYDLKNLLIGSEGTLAVITAIWLTLIPAPELMLPVMVLYPNAQEGCDAIQTVLASGLQPATLEFLDVRTVAAAAARFPFEPRPRGFLVIAEADGVADESMRLRSELVQVLSERSRTVWTPEGAEISALWRWRDAVSGAVTGVRGGKLSEDIVVPIDRLAEAIRRTIEIGECRGLEACSWGHAGDGNLHSTFLIDAGSLDELGRAESAADDLFALAVELGGSVSGEHGLGLLKAGQLRRQWRPAAVELHQAIKRAFDPRGLLNPGKKAP